MGDRGRQVITILSLVSLPPLLNAIMMIGTRILFAMGRDGMVPSLFHRVNPRTLTPVPATIIAATVIARFVQPMRDPVLAAKLVDLGVEAKASTPAELDRFFRRELDATRAIVRNAGIELE